MQTVIAAFEDSAQADRACEQLIQRGFDRNDVHVEKPDAGTMSDAGKNSTQARGSAGISGFFSSLFGDDDYQRHGSTWNEAVQRGNCVVVVDAQDERQADEATHCLRSLGAIDIDERASQWRAEGWTGSPQAADSGRSDTRMRDDAPPVGKEGVMDVIQEELNVGKRNVDQGGVRVIQRVSSKPVREVVRLRQERAVVDRRPVDRPADANEMSAFKEGTLEVRESAEEAVVSKKARVVEEVRVSKDVREREEVIEDKLRRKDVDVERIQGETRERAVASDTDNKSPLAGDREGDAGSRSSLTGSRNKKTNGSGPI